jgi:hypothetical protein
MHHTALLVFVEHLDVASLHDLSTPPYVAKWATVLRET